MQARPSRIVFLVLLSLLLLPSPAWSQTRRPPPRIPAAVTGFVQFSGGAGDFNSVLVQLESEMGEVIQQARLTGNGRFEFRGLDHTRYNVVARAPGYRDAIQRVDLTIASQQTVIVSLFSTDPKPRRSGSQNAARAATVPVQTLAIPDDAQQEFRSGQESLKNNAFVEALGHFQKAVDAYPDYLDARVALASVYIDQQKWDEAQAALSQCLEINDKYIPCQVALGALYNRQSKPAEARPVLERALELDPNSGQAHFELAQALLAENKAAEAETHALRAHELLPGDPLVHLALGNTVLRRNDLPTAKQEYQHYLDLAPDGPLTSEVNAKIAQIDERSRQPAPTAAPSAPVPEAARREFNAGRKDLEKGDLGKAGQHFAKALETHPAYVEAHHMRAMVLMNQQNWGEAEQAFKRCLELNPQFAPAHVGLGALYNLQDKPAEAAPLLRRAVELDSNSWQAHFELAQSLLVQGQLAEAETHARKAHELQASLAEVHVLLGNVSLRQRDLHTARQEFQHYLDLAPDGPLAPQLKAKIEQIDAALKKN